MLAFRITEPSEDNNTPGGASALSFWAQQGISSSKIRSDMGNLLWLRDLSVKMV